VRTHEIISWALRAIDQAKAGQPYEDSRVEFKSIWIEPREAARHIAGHANAARGEPILWLMGVLPTGEVSGVLAMELANWYPQVKSFFDESAPELIDVNITIGEVTVVAFLWNTEPAPFVFKTGRGDTPREVLYRHGTRNDAATRSQLIRILSPAVHSPIIELINGSLTITRIRNFRKKQLDRLDYAIDLDLFVVQPQANESIFVRHRSEMSLNLGSQKPILAGPVFFQTRTHRFSSESAPVKGSAELNVSARNNCDVPSTFDIAVDNVSVRVAFRFPHIDAPVTNSFILKFGHENDKERIWYGEFDPSSNVWRTLRLPWCLRSLHKLQVVQRHAGGKPSKPGTPSRKVKSPAG
jgi:hypothetical protein